MTDFIKTSREISAWLDAQKITIEVSRYAPKVYKGANTVSVNLSYIDHRPRNTGRIPDQYVCPFFGPGGEGNSLKALLALGYEIDSIEPFDDGRLGCFVSKFSGDGCLVESNKSCGIALHGLLEKLMEAK